MMGIIQCGSWMGGNIPAEKHNYTACLRDNKISDGEGFLQFFFSAVMSSQHSLLGRSSKMSPPVNEFTDDTI